MWSRNSSGLRPSCRGPDGKTFTAMGGEFTLVFQLKTFQGVRYCLFNYNTSGSPGGYADFDSFTVDEPRPHGLTKPIPVGQTITLTSLADKAAVLAVKDGSSFAWKAVGDK